VRLTQSKLQELGIELRRDVVIRSGSAGWLDQDLSHVDDALTGMPGDWNPATGKTIKFAEVDRSDPADLEGGHTDPDNTITMKTRGMGSEDYKASCPALKGLTRHKQSIRHELGHTVHFRMLTKARELFELMEWREFPPASPDLAAELGDSAAAFLKTLGSTRLVRGKRTYFKSPNGLVHSLGKPAELPDGHEFDYARWSQSEYFAEIYAYLINEPALMQSKLSQKQLDWWKDNVFGGTLPA
jgi:hypothetical protein